MGSHSYRFGNFSLDTQKLQLSRGDEAVHLEPTVLRLLVYLVKNRDRLVKKDELLETIWPGTFVTESALTKAVGRLREALDDDPSEPSIVETARGLGFRFIADVEEIISEVGDSAGNTSPKWRPPATIRRAGVVVLLTVLVAGGIWIGRRGWQRGPGNSDFAPIRSLAVLPLKNLGDDPEQDYLVEGFHETLITELSKAADLKVISRHSSMLYKDTPKPIPEIARELRVDALVEGGVLLVDGQVQITAQLIRGATDEHVWAETYKRDLGDVLGLLEQVAREVTDEIQVVVSPDKKPRLSRAVQVDPEVQKAYFKARYLANKMTPAAMGKSAEFLQQAIDLDPSFAPAWAGLAGAHAMMAYYGSGSSAVHLPPARAAALRALELDDRLSDAHSALGWVRFFEWDWRGARKEFETALAINPSDLFARHGLADCLALAGLPEEALEQVKTARDRDPFSWIVNNTVPGHLYFMGRCDEAINETRQLLELDSDHPAREWLARCLWRKGEFGKALSEYRKFLASRGADDLAAVLTQAGADSAPRGALRAVADRLVHRSESRYVDPFRIALTYAWAGEAEGALQWLERAYQARSVRMAYVKFRPEFDALRDDARFEDLLQRLKFPRREAEP